VTDLKTVFVEGLDHLLVTQATLDQMGLKAGQTITEAQMFETIHLNTVAFTVDMDLRRLAGEENIPDTAELKEKLKKMNL